MTMNASRTGFMCSLLASVLLMANVVRAEESSGAETPVADEEAATEEAPSESVDEASPAAETSEGAVASSQTAEVPEDVVRLGRVESILIANDDPESALDFAQEMLNDRMDSARLRLLLGACYMRLQRYDEALAQFNRVVQMAGDDHSLHLRGLYNTARALHGAGRAREAAEAYDRYVTFAQGHSDLDAFVEIAQRLSRSLRAQRQTASR